MQKNDRWPEEYDPSQPKSRASSRRNSATHSRRSSLKKDKSPPSSNSSTPKKSVKQNLDFVVTGKQITKRSDRANSLPGTYHRRPSTELAPAKGKRTILSPKRVVNTSNSSKSQETSLDDDASLDLSQVSDFEDTNSKYGIKKKFSPPVTSTPKIQKTQKTRRCSLQSQIHVQKLENSRREKSLDSKLSFSSMSRDSMRTSSSGYRYGSELGYSSVSPEYSGQSSADISPRVGRQDDMTPRSQDMQASSCCVSSFQDCSDMETTVEDFRRMENGEWNNFWANYNNSVSGVPLKSYYDQCPTPYRTDTFDLGDLVLPGDLPNDETRKPSPENMRAVNQIIRQEGLHLTPRETQNMIKCAHILGNVLSRAIERQSNEPNIQEANENPAREEKRKNLTLDLKETNVPVQEETRKEMTTQTDISLPNTKSAPRIFENILRQLSRSSLEDKIKECKENAQKKVRSDDKKELNEEKKDEKKVLMEAKKEINEKETDKNKDKKETNIGKKEINEGKTEPIEDKKDINEEKNDVKGDNRGEFERKELSAGINEKEDV